MKSLFKPLIAGTLSYMARRVLKKYHPKVIMITGSVGKTSTKDAIAATLREKYFIRASEKSYNSEFGVPLTIIGASNPWLNPVKWLGVFAEAAKLILLKNHYPMMLVLEVGADRPGDLAKILKIATPDVVVVTRLPEVPVHVEAYATPEAVREEEFAPAYALAPGAPLILSCDDTYAYALAAPLATHLITFGADTKADVLLSNEHVYLVDGQPLGMRATVTVGHADHTLTVHGALGRPQLLAPAAAIATGIACGMSVAECLHGLESYLPPPGRGRILHGQHGSVLIDDSYNASPAAVHAALGSLALLAQSIAGARRIVVLGDMLELGRYSSSEHKEVGKRMHEHADVLVTIGPRTRATAASAIEHGMPEDQVHSFSTSHEAAEFLEGMVQAKDLVLIKGSQSIRTERVVYALLEDPADAVYMVRQDTQWKKR